MAKKVLKKVRKTPVKEIVYYDDGTKKVVSVNGKPSMTDPSFAKQTDVNLIVSKYKKTGQLTHLAGKAAVFADVSEVSDLTAAYEKVNNAQTSFMALPSEIRNRFDNSVLKFGEFIADPNNADEAISLGLLPKPKDWKDPYHKSEPQPDKAPVDPPKDS